MNCIYANFGIVFFVLTSLTVLLISLLGTVIAKNIPRLDLIWGTKVSLVATLFAVVDTVLVVVEVTHRQALLLDTPSMASLELPSNLLLVIL